MSLGTPEIVLVVVLVLVLFGPTRLPDLARTIGRGMREVRKVTGDFQQHFNLDLDDDAPPRTRRDQAHHYEEEDRDQEDYDQSHHYAATAASAPASTSSVAPTKILSNRNAKAKEKTD